MNEYNKIIIAGSYADAFAGKAFENGYAKLYDFSDFDDDQSNENDFFDSLPLQHSKKNPYKTAVLQMFLLFDKIILYDPSISGDYKKLNKTGFVESVTIENYPDLAAFPDDDPATKEYARLLKPIIIEHMLQSINKAERIGFQECELRPRIFFSWIFDSIYSPELSESYSQKQILKILNYIDKGEKRFAKKFKKS